MNVRGRALRVALATATTLAAALGEATMAEDLNLAVPGRVRSADGVEIAYTDQGSGPVAIVFIHGGLADRTFWARQFAGLGSGYRLVALDLAGHGASGMNRKEWTVAAW